MNNWAQLTLHVEVQLQSLFTFKLWTDFSFYVFKVDEMKVQFKYPTDVRLKEDIDLLLCDQRLIKAAPNSSGHEHRRWTHCLIFIFIGHKVNNTFEQHVYM